MTFTSILDFFMSSAHAATAGGMTAGANPPPGAGNFNLFIIMLIFLGAMYFMIWRPQSKRAKEQRDLIKSIAKGDEVVTIGGLMGRVNKVTDTYIVLSVSDTVEVTFQKAAVSTILPKGTLKSI